MGRDSSSTEKTKVKGLSDRSVLRKNLAGGGESRRELTWGGGAERCSGAPQMTASGRAMLSKDRKTGEQWPCGGQRRLTGY
eukprot:3214243-Pleurochrysis_carterae.AAC.1